MSVFIKICGICSRKDLEQICALGPDAIGFIFWPNAGRYVRPEQVATWLPAIPETIKKVGVFVEPPADTVESIARTCELDVIQIHLVSNDWKIDRPLFHGLEIWLSPRMSEGVTENLLKVVDPEPSVLLADSFDPNTVGGTGKLSSWDRAVEMKETLGRPVMLAGGLNADNVAEAIDVVHPWGVDVSSGVEKEPGVKNIRKVKKFIKAVRG
ncbi:phosphoribosylanthranilate isomerase [Tichowtungia aerotolerans]|uniref:N-(5'-phosphoribosyl)anthranilate isomerase n=1 Tax=Tichowtungia aerotolerans TaxID=2697043 RepID=A0A6P1M2U2_9BACT|nr:phosphoribosylanthranilate isomerase [Tichowtungia aerotolerans]QHI68412.1 N-(5'-phosphoribosyl)anthranilate isomerase [Tichowtungia aerotolerans]